MNKKIASVVITFNRKKQLLQNLKQQMIQSYPLDTIIIIDNCSTDGTYDYIVEHGLLSDKRVVYITMKENLGGAGGFERGIKEAFARDVDYALLMDDDGYALNEDTVKSLIEKTDVKNELVMVNSLVLCDSERLSFGLTAELNSKSACESVQKNGVIEQLINPFNGTLISRALYEKIGAPIGAFFIRGDEQEYHLRAKESGAYIATVVGSLYYHPALAERGIKKILGRTFVNNYDSPWKEYYETRNMTYVYRQRSKIRAYKRYFKRMIGLYVFKIKDKKNMIQFIKLGYKHGKQGILGKTILPGQNEL